MLFSFKPYKMLFWSILKTLAKSIKTCNLIEEKSIKIMRISHVDNEYRVQSNLFLFRKTFMFVNWVETEIVHSMCLSCYLTKAQATNGAWELLIGTFALWSAVNTCSSVFQKEKKQSHFCLSHRVSSINFNFSFYDITKLLSMARSFFLLNVSIQVTFIENNQEKSIRVQCPNTIRTEMNIFTTIFIRKRTIFNTTQIFVRNSKTWMRNIFTKVSYSRALHVQPFMHICIYLLPTIVARVYLNQIIWYAIYAQTMTGCHARYDFKSEIQNEIKKNALQLTWIGK